MQIFLALLLANGPPLLNIIVSQGIGYPNICNVGKGHYLMAHRSASQRRPGTNTRGALKVTFLPFCADLKLQKPNWTGHYAVVKHTIKDILNIWYRIISRHIICEIRRSAQSFVSLATLIKIQLATVTLK